MEQKQNKKKNTNELENYMINTALNDLTYTQKGQYQKIGEKLFNKVNQATAQLINNPDVTINDITYYIEDGFKSGLLPKDLNIDEKKHMIETFGEKWYLKYNFTEEDLE
jgi:hypothetical protein